MGSAWTTTDWLDWDGGYWDASGYWVPHKEVATEEMEEEKREEAWNEEKWEKDTRDEEKDREHKTDEKAEEKEHKKGEKTEENQEYKKDEKAEEEEHMKDENAEEKELHPTIRRRHSRKKPEEGSSGLTVTPAEKKDLPVKWGPIKNLQAALKLFRNSGPASEKQSEKGLENPKETDDTIKEEKPTVTWWDEDMIASIPGMTIAEKIRLVLEFPTLEKLEGWRPPQSQLPRLAWHSLLDIANLVFNYAVLEPADIVRHLKEGSVPGSKSVTLKYVEDLRDMTMDQCTSLYQWLTLFVNREMLEKHGPGHAFYSAMLNDKIWSEVVAVHSLVWDWWFESPHTVLMYVLKAQTGSLLPTLSNQRKCSRRTAFSDCPKYTCFLVIILLLGSKHVDTLLYV